MSSFRHSNRATVSALADEHCTLTLLVPTMLGMVLASGALDGADLGTAGTDVRRITDGEVQRRVAEGFGCELYHLYGMRHPQSQPRWMGRSPSRNGGKNHTPAASGQPAPAPGVRCEVRRRWITRRRWRTGRNLYQGPNIMAGYWNRPEETAHALVDGWYRSGDVAWKAPMAISMSSIVRKHDHLGGGTSPPKLRTPSTFTKA